MARTDKSGERLTLWRHQRLLKGNAFVARQDRLANADQAVAMAHGGRYIGNLITVWLSLPDRAAEVFERFEEKRLDVMGLQTPRLGPLHVFPNAVYATHVHGIVGQRPFFEQLLKLGGVEGVGYDLGEPGSHIR